MVNVVIVMNPELRKRFIDSIEYLKKLDFFQDYSHLSSEEILEKIFSGEINYMYWWREWGKERHPAPLWGRILRKSIERDENSWMKSSNAEIDYCIIPFDTKRAIEEDIETMLG
ncbi:MAG: hypothetical protein N3D12_06710, partial [Candidatus Methanomethyliaceae archaeon]|nr:hypothetical protein [Candidatus Methanomethyliaceae archaeon]